MLHRKESFLTVGLVAVKKTECHDAHRFGGGAFPHAFSNSFFSHITLDCPVAVLCGAIFYTSGRWLCCATADGVIEGRRNATVDLS